MKGRMRLIDSTDKDGGRQGGDKKWERESEGYDEERGLERVVAGTWRRRHFVSRWTAHDEGCSGGNTTGPPAAPSTPT